MPTPHQQIITTEDTNIDPVMLLEKCDLTGDSDLDNSDINVDYETMMLELNSEVTKATRMVNKMENPPP